MGLNKIEVKEFLNTYGIAILTLIILATLIFGFNSSKSKLELLCKNLVVAGDGIDYVYPLLNRTGYDLLTNSNAVSVIYDVSKAEPKSDKKMLKEGGVVFCRVPIDACFTMIQYKGVSICQDFSFTIPVDYSEFKGWYKDVKDK